MNLQPKPVAYSEAPFWFERLMANLSTRFDVSVGNEDREIEVARKLVDRSGLSAVETVPGNEELRRLIVRPRSGADLDFG